MPELPEVETIRRGLAAKILHKPVVSIELRKRSLLKSPSVHFLQTLKNNQFIAIERIGKLLIWHLQKGEHYLLVHLKMTGQLIYVLDHKIIAGGHNLPPVDHLPNKYSHIILNFKDGSRLFFNDLRQFGYFKLVSAPEKIRVKNKFGIEPLTPQFTWKNWQLVLGKRTAPIKSVLLNQQLISGIGNIYADEICFRAKVLPTRKTNTLKPKESKELFLACRYIIAKAVKHRGTTFSDYRDSEGQSGNYVKYLKVYGRAGKVCLRCHQAKISKTKLSGRGTHFCKNCQK